MKNIALTLATIVLLAACSSGSTVAPLPSTVNSQFSGNFNSQNGNQNGTIRLDISETDGGAVSGNIIVTNNTNVRCIANGTISNGVSNGFNLSFTSTQSRDRFQIVTMRTRVTGTDDMGNPTTTTTTNTVFSDAGTEGVRESDDGRGNRTTVTTTRETVTGAINFQIAISNNGNTLSGTYVTDGDLCSNGTGTGDFVLNRIT